jgi:hypothetical protein
MRGLKEFEAAIFDEGNIAPAELDLGRSLWCAVRNNTACRRSAMPASRWSSALSATYRACAASSSTSARNGRSAEALVEYKVFAICSLAPAITAFAASRIGWVER